MTTVHRSATLRLLAFANIPEQHHRADDGMLLDDGRAGALDRNTRPVMPPEDLPAHVVRGRIKEDCQQQAVRRRLCRFGGLLALQEDVKRVAGQLLRQVAGDDAGRRVWHRRCAPRRPG